MRELLQSNADYVQFLFGLAFIPLAVQAHYLRLLGDRRLSWARFSVYAALAACAGLAALPAIAVGHPSWLQALSLGLLAASGFALVEFARASAALVTGRPVTLWVHAVLLVAIGVGTSLGGSTGLEIAIVWVGVVGAGAAAATVMWLAAARGQGGLVNRLRIAAAVFAGYAALSAFAAPGAPYFPMSVLNHATLLQVTGLPDQVLRLAAIFVLSQVLGGIGWRLQPFKLDTATEIVAHVAFPLLIAVGLLMTNVVGNQGYASFRSELVSDATVAATLFGEAVRTTATGSFIVDPSIAASRLKILRSGRADIGAVAVVAPAAKAPAFFDTGPSTESHGHQTGELDSAAPLALRAFRTGQVQIEDSQLSTDPWVTAYAPVYDAAPGGPVAVVAMEVSGVHWQSVVASYRLSVIAATFFLFLLTMLYYASTRVQRLGADRVTASETRFRAIFENAPEAVFIADAGSTAIIAANPRMSELMGYRNEELLEMALLDLPDPRSIEEIFDRGADPAGSALRYRRADGTSVDVEMTSASLVTDGRPSVLSFVRDVTERRRAASELSYRAQVERLIANVVSRFVDVRPGDVNAVIETSLEEIGLFSSADHAYHLVLAGDGRTVASVLEWWRPGAERPVPAEWTAIKEIPWVAEHYERQRCVRVDDVTRLPEEAADYRELLESQGVRSTLVVPVMSGDQAAGRLAIESMGEPVTWSEDTVSLLSALGVVFSNAIGRAETERQLEKLSAALELSPSTVIIADRHGIVEWVNAKFSTTFGWTAGEVVGRPWTELALGPAEVADAMRAAVAEVDSGGEWHGEVELQRRDGSRFWAQQAASALRDADGKVAHYFTLIENIDGLKQIQRDLEAARREAVVASEAKGEFLANMSHEIRTPMNAIIGMGELLAQTGLANDQARYVRNMTSAGQSLLSLINSVLDLSKIEAGAFELEERMFDLPDELARTCEVMDFQARQKGLELVCEVDEGVPRYVRGDPERLRQVLFNLLGNAVKFTEEGTVTASVNVSAHDPALLVFSVEDTGIGIASEKLRLVFDRFTQADSSTTHRYGGTGLGLAISKALVELMGGTISAVSEVGRGTTFTFTARMPETPAVEPAEAAARGLSAWDEVTCILVAEDSEDNELLVESFLVDGPYEVTFVQDGREAVEAFTSAGPGAFDLVLMDIQMPVMDGLEATVLIRAWESEHQVVPTPIVALTAYAMKGDTEYLREAGCTGHLAKPVPQRRLIEAIATYARRRDHEKR